MVSASVIDDNELLRSEGKLETNPVEGDEVEGVQLRVFEAGEVQGEEEEVDPKEGKSGAFPRDMYACPEFWDSRFQNISKNKKNFRFFDWYCGWEELQEIVLSVIGPERLAELGFDFSKYEYLAHLANGGSKDLQEESIKRELSKLRFSILMVGCGNSRLPEELVEGGFPCCSSVDLSSSVVAQMQKKYQGSVLEGKLRFFCCDARALGSRKDSEEGSSYESGCPELQTGAFDMIIEKGTLDAILCDPKEESRGRAAKELLEGISRVLKERDGNLFLVSHSPCRASAFSSVTSLSLVHLFKCDLSSEALIINILRTRGDKNSSLSSSVCSPSLLVASLKEHKEALFKKTFRQIVRRRRIRKNGLLTSQFEDFSGSADDKLKAQERRKEEPLGRQDHCWLYVLKKR